MARSKPREASAQTRRRRRQYRHGRGRQISFRATEDEYEQLAEAGEKLGLTPTGFAALGALDAARRELDPKRRRRAIPDHNLLRQAIAEVQIGTNQVNRAGANLNQAMAKFHTEGVPPQWLESAAAQVLGVVEEQDRKVAELAQLVREAVG